MNQRNETLLTLPGKIIVAGKYNDNKDGHLMPFVALVDTQSWGRPGYSKPDSTMIKCFYSEGKHSISKKNAERTLYEITALNYGPYDNGHIILGFNTGFIMILNSIDLAGMFRIQIFEPYF